MAQNLTQKILSNHLASGRLVPGEEIGIKIDQTLTQDATGTMACLQFEAIGVDRVRTKLSLSYVDHNMLQVGFENADDHRFLQMFASKYGINFSRPGNGICHQVHLERFAIPGQTLLGSDSHTPTSGGMGMIAIGAGGLDVAVAMGGGLFYTATPKVVGVKLIGKLQPWVAAKDIILEVLRRLTVKGGIGRVMEYIGEGVKSLSVPERATITNMGAELGATTSIFPSDENTLAYLKAQGRQEVWVPLEGDPDATYDEMVEINLNELEPLIAQPQSPDNVCRVRDIEGLKVDQVCVGSCTNSSYRELMTVAAIMKGKKVHTNVSMTLNPGSRQVYLMIARSGALADLIESGVRIEESACGPCIGSGQSPGNEQVSLRTFNRNFNGRSGTDNDKVYLCSPEVAAAAAITGQITDPRKLGEPIQVDMPERFLIDDSLIIPPSPEPEKVEIVRGPNIALLPVAKPIEESLTGEILLKVGDNITTDHITPAGQWLKYRSNVPKYSEAVFHSVDPAFPQRAREKGGGFVVGGENYGQGSSREHAALLPMYLGLKGVIAKSFARIHRANLVNFGIIPLTFGNTADYERITQGDQIEINGIRSELQKGTGTLNARNVTKGYDFLVKYALTPREIDILLAGGLLNYTK